MSDRPQVSVRLTDAQHELLRRRCVADQITMQTALAAGINCYILGNLVVKADGRYEIDPRGARIIQDVVTVRAPTDEDPDRKVDVHVTNRTRKGKLSTKWLTEHLAQRCGKHVSQRATRKFLKYMEEEGMVEPRDGRYWRFDGPEDERVVAVRIALDDGRWDDFFAEQVEQVRAASGE